jgi:hypothetical protein
LVSAFVEKTNATDATTVSSTTFDSTSALVLGNTFGLRIKGAALNTFTMPASVNTRAKLITQLTAGANWSLGAPAGITFATGGLADGTATLTISLDADAVDHRIGACRNFELVAGSLGTDVLLAVKLTAGLYSASAEPTVRVKFARTNDNINEDSDDKEGDIGGQSYLEIGATATTCTLSITNTLLTTTAAGGTATSLSIKLADYSTLTDLAEYINTLTGYSCAVTSGVNGGLNPSTVLDHVTSLGIAATGSVKPGKIKIDAYSVYTWIYNYSQVVSLTPTSYCGLPNALVKTFLSGGVAGISVNSDFTSALSAP